MDIIPTCDSLTIFINILKVSSCTKSQKSAWWNLITWLCVNIHSHAEILCTYTYLSLCVRGIYKCMCMCAKETARGVGAQKTYCIFFHCYTYKIFYIQFLVKRLWWVLSYCEMFLHDIHGCTMFAVLLKTRLGKLFVADFLL